MIINALNKYKELALPVKASLWFTICSVLQKGISFITMPIFTRILTTEQFGQYNVFMSWQSIIMIFATMQLFYGVFNKGMVKFEHDKDGFTSSIQGLISVLTIGVCLLFLIAFPITSKIMNMSLYVMIALFIQILFSASVSLWLARMQYDFKYKGLAIVTVGLTICNPLLGILATLSTENKGLARIFSVVIVQVLFGTVIYYINLKKGRIFYHKKYWKYAFLFNLPLIPHYLSQVVLTQSDRIMISIICGTQFAGIYGVAFSLSQVLNILTNSINSSFVPWQFRKIKEGKIRDISKVVNMMLCLLAIFLIIFIAIAPELITIVAAPSYYAAIWVIPPLSLTLFFSFLYTLFANIEFYYEERKYVLISSVSSAVINVLLNLVFIPIFGFIAAGYTTLFCFILYSIGHYFFMRLTLKKYGEGSSDFYSIKSIIIITLFMFLFSFVFVCLYATIFPRYLLLCLIIILLLILIIKFRGKLNLKLNSN